MKRDTLRLAKDVLSSRRKRADGGTDEWQSTGKLLNEDKSINWGDRDSPADFFRAEKELRLREEAKLADRAEPAPAPKRTAEGRQMAPARVSPARSEEPAVEAPAPAPVRTAEGRQMAAPDWEYQEPLNDEQRKALALQQWTAAGQKGTPDDPVRDMMAIKAPSPSFGQPIPNAPNFAAAQGITPGAPEWRRASLPQEGGGKYTNRVAPLTPPAVASQETSTGMPRQALSFGPMPDAPAPVASQNQADQVWQRMITQESSNRQFDRSGRPITSRAGALGIAQVMPGTGPEAARLAGLPWSLDRLRNDPEYNHALGRAYYDEQLRQFGSPVLAAAAYNGGPGRVTKALALAARTNRPFTDFLKQETRDYVRIVASPTSRRAPLRFGNPEGYADGGRTGYADEGAVVPSDDGAVYDAMGNVAVPAATTDPDAKEGLYDAAMKKVGAADDRYVGPMNASVWDKPSGPGDDRYVGPMAVSDLKKPPEPKAPEGTLFSRSVDPITRAIKTVSDDYRKNLAHHSESAAALQSQANKDSSGERGWQGRLLAPLESANSMMGTAFAPVSAAATSVGNAATYLTGNPGFGQRAELLAGFADPSHVGLAKVGAMKLGKVAEDLAPYSAMFLPVARTDPALATAKQLLAEGKTADEIKAATGIHFGPESDFGSYELQSNVPDEFGRYRRQGEMPLNPESRPMKEISDEGLVLSRDPANDIPLTQNQTIESYTFEHPELASQFPELAGAYQDIKVHPDFTPEGSFYAHAEIAPGQWGPKLEVRASSVEEARSVVAHEAQHFVAEKGGIEQGADPLDPNLIDFHSHSLNEAKGKIAKAQSEMAAFAEPAVEKYKEYYKIDPNSDMGVWELNHIRHEAETQWLQNLKKTDPERAKDIERAMYTQQRVDTPYKMYQHMYGEALARATQDRLEIPKAERDQTPLRFHYNQYQGKGQPDILTPIPEENLFSNKNMSDYRLSNSGFVYSTPEPTVAQSRPSPIEPAGNLNFRPSITTEQLKGPERQTAQSFLDQIKTRPGFSKDSIEELAAKFPDRNAVVTKAEFESAVPKSEYSKVDLQPEGAKALKEFNETVKGDFEANLPDVFSNLLYDWFKVDMSPAEAAELVKFQKGEINYEQLPENLVTKLKSSDIWRKQELKEVLDETYNKGYNDVWDAYLEHSDYSMENFSDKLYKYEDDQRLVVDPKKHENNYAELGLTHPNLKGDYSHFDNTSEKVGPLGGHFRRTNFPEGGDIISDRKGDLNLPAGKLPISEKYQTFKTKPKSTVIEEIQSDSQQSEKQVGPLRQIHGAVFKTAIQDALESGSTTVYMPTSKPILAARDVTPETRNTLVNIYDKVIPKEGINPLKEIPGVTVNKVADGAYHEIDFTPEAIDYILKGPGQRTPGFKKGGAVERAMDISRFGTDAVQSAVNLARQHRGRPDS